MICNNILLTSLQGNDYLVSKEIIMAGITVFKTLAEALRAGFHVYDRTENGYIVRVRTSMGYQMALVKLR